MQARAWRARRHRSGCGAGRGRSPGASRPSVDCAASWTSSPRRSTASTSSSPSSIEITRLVPPVLRSRVRRRRSPGALAQLARRDSSASSVACTCVPAGASRRSMRCEHGAVDDVVVDIRPHSPTFRRQQRFRLDDVDHHQLFLPPGVTPAAAGAHRRRPRLLPALGPVRPGGGARSATTTPPSASWPITPVITSDNDAAAPLADLLATG